MPLISYHILHALLLLITPCLTLSRRFCWKQNHFPIPTFKFFHHILSCLVGPYHTLSHLILRLETKPFSIGTLKISFQVRIFLSLLITPYPLSWKQNHFHLATLKLVLRIMLLLHFALGIKNSFPDCITRVMKKCRKK